MDTAKIFGNAAILASMEGKTAAVFTFKKSGKVKIDGVTVQIDPQLLFQRLTIAAKAVDKIEDIFKYELCSYPPALFDSSLLLREPKQFGTA